MRNIILSLALLAAVSAGAQVTTRSAFTTAPADVIATIPETTRLDMLDYAESGVARASSDEFGSPARITRLDEQVLRVGYGDNSLDLILLPQGKKQVIMVIKRIATPAIDSDIKIYNSRWEEIHGAWSEPSLQDWLAVKDKSRITDLENALPFIMYSAEYDPETKTLTLTPDFNGYIAREDIDNVKQMIKPRLTYLWTGKKFTLKK